MDDIILREDWVREDVKGYRCQEHNLPVTYSKINKIADGKYNVCGVEACCEKFKNRMTDFINQILIPKRFYNKRGEAINR